MRLSEMMRKLAPSNFGPGAEMSDDFGAASLNAILFADDDDFSATRYLAGTAFITPVRVASLLWSTQKTFIQK